MRSMLAHAYHWRVAGFDDDIPLSRYTENWGRPGDLALIAMEGGHPIGAAWLRRFSSASPGLRLRRRGDARADDRRRPSRRRHGIGQELLDALVERARRGRLPRRLAERRARTRRRSSSTSGTASSRWATSTARSRCSSGSSSERGSHSRSRAILDRTRVDRVRDRRLAVGTSAPAAVSRSRAARPNSTGITGSSEPWRSSPAAAAASRSSSKPSTSGTKPREREDRRRPPAAPRRGRARSDITAPCEKPPSTIRSCGQRVEPVRSLGVARAERRRIGVADPRHDVPVRAARRQGQRPARRVAVQPPLRVERVEQREQVVLVGAAAVEEDERALGLAGRRALADGHTSSRGFGSGVSRGSISARRCS